MWLAVAAILPWILAYFALGGSPQAITKNIENFGKAVTQGPISTVVNAWVEVALITAGLGLGIWFLEIKVGKHEGIQVGAPAAPTLSAPAPGFGGGASAGIAGGPVRLQSGTSAQTQGGPQVQYVEPPSGGFGAPGRGPSGPRTTRVERRAQRARLHADIEEARRREQRARQERRSGGKAA